MKKYIYLLSTLLVFSLSFSSCSDDDDDILYSLSVKPEKLIFNNKGDTQHLTVDAENVDWQFKSSDTWIQTEINPRDPNQVLVTVGENTTNKDRQGTITFVGKNVQSVVINVTQTSLQVESSLIVEPTNLRFTSASETQRIQVKAENTKWEIMSSPSWATYTVDPDDANVIIVTAKENTTAQGRTGKLVVSGTNVEEVSVDLEQYASTTEASIIWDQNSLFYAKLQDKVSFVDYTDFQGSNVLFDADGYVTNFDLTLYDESNNEIVFKVSYEYNLDRKLTRIHTATLDIDFTYDNHQKYIDVGGDMLAPSGLSPFYLFAPQYVKGISSVKATIKGEQPLQFDVRLSENDVNILADGQLWRVIRFDNQFVAEKTYAERGQKKDADGVVQKYTATIDQEFAINATNGKLQSIISYYKYEFDNTEIPTEEEEVKYTFLQDKYNNLEYEGANIHYTYDVYGEWDRITAKTTLGENVDQYEYTRDEKGNWTNRIDRAIFNGEEWVYNDTRKVEYHK